MTERAPARQPKKLPRMSPPAEVVRVVNPRLDGPSPIGRGHSRYPTPEVLKEVCEEYITKCEQAKIWPSKPGMKAYLGFSDASYRRYIGNHGSDDRPPEFQEVMHATEQMIEAVLVQALLSRNAGWGAHKLLMMYHGWKDTQYIEVGRALELLQTQLKYVIETYVNPSKWDAVFSYLERGSQSVEQKFITDERRADIVIAEEQYGRGVGEQHPDYS